LKYPDPSKKKFPACQKGRTRFSSVLYARTERFIRYPHLGVVWLAVGSSRKDDEEMGENVTLNR
jgi:hypothetical protein